MKIYMAGAFFRPETKSKIDSYVADFRRLGHDVYVPQEHTVPNAWDMSQEDWAREVFKMDVAAIQECDMVFVVYDGLYSDSGTAWEIGYAYAHGKNIQISIIDFIKHNFAISSFFLLHIFIQNILHFISAKYLCNYYTNNKVIQSLE